MCRFRGIRSGAMIGITVKTRLREDKMLKGHVAGMTSDSCCRAPLAPQPHGKSRAQLKRVSIRTACSAKPALAATLDRLSSPAGRLLGTPLVPVPRQAELQPIVIAWGRWATPLQTDKWRRTLPRYVRCSPEKRLVLAPYTLRQILRRCVPICW